MRAVRRLPGTGRRRGRRARDRHAASRSSSATTWRTIRSGAWASAAAAPSTSTSSGSKTTRSRASGWTSSSVERRRCWSRRSPASSGRLIVARAGRHRRRARPMPGRRAARRSTCARDRLRAPYPASGPESIGGADVFFDVTHAAARPRDLRRRPRRGARRASMAWTLGFAVTVVDVREAFLTADRFPDATLVSAHFSQLRRAA